jgi:hypothetical protein
MQNGRDQAFYDSEINEAILNKKPSDEGNVMGLFPDVITE